MDSMQLETKELLTYHCGCHGDLVTIATKYVADDNSPIKPSYQIWTQHDSRERHYKVKGIRLRLITLLAELVSSLSSTFPTFYISISHLCKPALPGFHTCFELPHPETWIGFQTSSGL